MTPNIRRSRSRRSVRALVPALALLAAACGGGGDGAGNAAEASDGEAESCYEGETVTFVVPYAPGGGYDTVARAAAPSLEEELGATVVVENQPGAGGLTAANTLFAGEADGRTFAIMPGVGLLGAALAETQGVGFDPLEFTFVARVAPDVRLMVVSPQSGMTTIEEVQDGDGVAFASTGPGGADHIDATVVSRILDLDGEVVSGFAGSAETSLAVTTGDVDAVFSSLAGLLNSVESGDTVPVLIAGQERAEELPDVPALLELELDDDQQALAEAHSELQEAGRSIIAPPGVPAGCRDQLEAAFEATVADPGFLELLEGSNEEVEFLSGTDLEDIYRSVMEESPAEYVDLMKDAFEGQ